MEQCENLDALVHDTLRNYMFIAIRRQDAKQIEQIENIKKDYQNVSQAWKRGFLVNWLEFCWGLR